MLKNKSVLFIVFIYRSKFMLIVYKIINLKLFFFVKKSIYFNRFQRNTCYCIFLHSLCPSKNIWTNSLLCSVNGTFWFAWPLQNGKYSDKKCWNLFTNEKWIMHWCKSFVATNSSKLWYDHFDFANFLYNFYCISGSPSNDHIRCKMFLYQ